MSSIAAFAITEAIQYGPEFVMKMIEVLRKPESTIADVEALFASVKPYSEWNIPAVAPTKP